MKQLWNQLTDWHIVLFTEYATSGLFHHSFAEISMSQHAWEIEMLSSQFHASPHLVQSGLWHREVNDAQLLIVVGQHIEGTSQAAGVWGQLVLQHVLVALLQVDAGEEVLHVGVDGARVLVSFSIRVSFSVRQAKDDGVAITKPGQLRMERNII